jgi:uncharacterized membrane protein YcgQ (UPF0703/DUF1980 family)
MKKISILLMMVFALIVSCGNKKAQKTGVFVPVQSNAAGTLSVSLSAENTEAPSEKSIGFIEIKEKMFIAQTNDVYLNAEDYLGKTIKLEGLFKYEQYGNANYCFVLRYGPGCCGSDGNAGFEVAWNKAANKTYPAADEWVEAIGVLKTYKENDNPYLYLDLTSLTVMDTRGREFVMQ